MCNQPISRLALLSVPIVMVACVPIGAERPATLQPTAILAGQRPNLSVDARPYWAEGFDAAYAVALRNLHQPNSFHRTRHARAAPQIRGVHLWDSAFQSQIWRAWNVEIAQELVVAVLDKANDGRVPHFSHRLLRSNLTQPPVLAWTVWENYLWSGRVDHLDEVYAALISYNEWLYQHRRLPSGLFFWQSHLESGKDNSPRFDRSRGDHTRDLARIAAVDLSSYVALENARLARIAAVLGRQTERLFYERRAAELRTLINSLLWDEGTGLYYDRYEPTGELIKVRTAASLLPLLAAVPDSARARRLRDHAMDAESFNSPMPLPSVALDEPSFSKDMWRGPVWINVSYMIIKGLEAYGFADEAAELAFRTVEGVFRTHLETRGIWEFYDPQRFDLGELHRKRGNVGKQLTLGDKPLPEYGWSGLVNTLLIEMLVGYRSNGDRHWIAPRLPAAATGMRLRMNLPDRSLTIGVERGPDGVIRGEWQLAGESGAFSLPAGEELQLRGATLTDQRPGLSLP